MNNLRKFTPLLVLLLALFVGTFFRFYKLGATPNGVHIDEAALGYNAYSISKTGKDEFGKSFPIMFRSFTTFQSPVYTYLLVPLMPIFGLTPFSVRLPSAFFGSLTLLVFYLLVKKISPDKYRTQLSLISVVFLAISPWHILYSRTAYETNVALFFLLLGALFFFHSLKKSWLFILSAISFAISFSAYRAETFLVPLLVLVLAIRFLKPLSQRLGNYAIPVLISSIIGFLLILPTVSIMRTPGFQARTSALNIFSSTLQKPWGYQKAVSPIQKSVNRTVLLSFKEFFSLYTSYFSPRYIFSIGDSGPRKPFPDLATFFVWQFPFLLVGFYFLIKEKDLTDLKTFVFTILLLSPIPASLTREPYSTIRSLPMVVPLVIITAFGTLKMFEILSHISSKTKYLIVCLLILVSTAKMYISIFHFNDYFRLVYWDYGWQRVVDTIPDLDPNIPIQVDNSRGHPYIELLFFLQYDPATYQRDNFEVSAAEYYTNMTRNPNKNLGRITVKDLVWGTDTENVEKYIFADGLTISEQQIAEHHLTLIDEVRYPSGEVAFKIIKTNPKIK